MKRVTALAFVVAALSACVGQGDGTVKGNLHVNNCSDGKPFDAPNYNMNPEFFVGEPIEDLPQQQDAIPLNRLEIRIQAASGNLGGVITSLDMGAGIDTLFISIADVAYVARNMETPIPVTPLHPTLPATGVTPVRAALQLLGTCPFSPSNYLPADTEMMAMPPTMSSLVFHQFGGAKAGSQPPADFKVAFGEDIQADFDFVLVDERAQLGLEAPLPAGATPSGGHITGNFSFELRRGQAGQTFP